MNTRRWKRVRKQIQIRLLCVAVLIAAILHNMDGRPPRPPVAEVVSFQALRRRQIVEKGVVI